MNLRLLSAALLLTAPATHAAIPLPGSMVYTQAFDNLATTNNGSTSATTWADDSTIPGWILYTAGDGTATNPMGPVGAAYTYRVSNGIAGVGNAGGLADTGHFYSIGALAGTDRAIGAVPITGKGEHSVFVVFENTSGTRVRLTRIAFSAEVWRTNQTASVTETIACSWRKGNSQTELLTNTAATATAAVWPSNLSTTPTGRYLTGWNQMPEAYYTYTTPAAPGNNVRLDPPLSTAVSTAPASEILLETGEFLAVRWGNINDAGADAIMGIDDVELTFVAEDTGVTAAVSAITRNDAGSPRVPGDDTVSARLTVNTTAGGAQWVITAPASLAGRSGDYGVPFDLVDVPLAEFTGAAHVVSVRVQDRDNAAASAQVQWTAPWCQISADAATGFTYDTANTATAADDTVTYFLTPQGLFTGDTAAVTPPTPAAMLAYGSPQSITMPAPGTYVTHSFTDSAEPLCRATLHVFPPGIIGENAVTGTAVPLFSAPIAQAGAVHWTINGTARTLVQRGSPVQTDHVILSGVVDLSTAGDMVFSARLVLEGGASGFETADSFALDLIIDGTPVSVLTAAQDPDNNGRLNGAAELPVGAVAARTVDLVRLIPAAASSVQIRVTGNSNSPEEIFTLSAMKLAAPVIYSIGAFPGSGPIQTAVTPAPAPEWVVSGTPPVLTMNAAGLVAPLKRVTSEVITLPAGAWQVSAHLHVDDKTGGFEADDVFNAWVITDGNAASPLPLITAHDTNADGRMTGAELCPAPAVIPTPQAFDYPLAAIIPPGTQTVQIIIEGLSNSLNETMIVSNLLISPAGSLDTDGDGVSDAIEDEMGTDPASAASVLRLTDVPGGFSFPTVAGRFYRVYASSTDPAQSDSHLQVWEDTGTTITGDGGTGSFTVTPVEGVPRRFFRLLVQRSDAGWPPQLP
jgi:hypothetical protein